MIKNIENYYNKIIETSYDAKSWQKDRTKVNKDINNFEKLFKELSNKVDESKDSSDPNVLNTINKIQSELEKSKAKIFACINKIRDKVMNFTPMEMNESEENNLESNNQIMTMDLMNNKEVLEQRRKELEDIHKTAAALKDTTDQMALVVEKQGAQLDEIEANVIKSNENAEKAKEEIVKADEISRGNRKKMCCLILIIFLAIAGITAILLSIIFA